MEDKTDIQVHKFGGASIRDANRIANVVGIIKNYVERPAVLIVSAMGKTTNLLENVVNAHFDDPSTLGEMLTKVKNEHLQIIRQLLPDQTSVADRLNDLFVEMEWALDETDVNHYDYVYDQVVAMGELFSTTLLADYLLAEGLPVTWMDARDLVYTDRTFRQAKIDWGRTEDAIKRLILPELEAGKLVLTQGFIGCTLDNENTTLGREGSDYSAAIFAHCLNAKRVTVWKDVPGVMTGDPDRFSEVHKLDQLSFREAIEMTYYGAKVLHPKTIKPLQNRQIPLWVRSFLDPELAGTLIEDQVDVVYPPIVIVEEDQVLIQLSTPDYSFMEEPHLISAFQLLTKHGFKVNVMRNTAITLALVMQNRPRHLAALTVDLEHHFTVRITHNVWLVTVRHTQAATEEQLLQNRLILLEERFKDTVQFVTQELPAFNEK